MGKTEIADYKKNANESIQLLIAENRQLREERDELKADITTVAASGNKLVKYFGFDEATNGGKNIEMKVIKLLGSIGKSMMNPRRKKKLLEDVSFMNDLLPLVDKYKDLKPVTNGQ